MKPFATLLIFAGLSTSNSLFLSIAAVSDVFCAVGRASSRIKEIVIKDTLVDASKSTELARIMLVFNLKDRVNEWHQN